MKTIIIIFLSVWTFIAILLLIRRIWSNRREQYEKPLGLSADQQILKNIRFTQRLERVYRGPKGFQGAVNLYQAHENSSYDEAIETIIELQKEWDKQI